MQSMAFTVDGEDERCTIFCSRSKSTSYFAIANQAALHRSDRDSRRVHFTLSFSLLSIHPSSLTTVYSILELFAAYLIIITMSDRSPFDVPFDQLPNPKQVWVGSPGSYEEGLGKLAILTPEVVAKAAAAEIKTGRRVTMGWQLTKLDYPNLNRQPCHHQIVPLLGGVAFDDIFTMNPRMFRASWFPLLGGFQIC